ncbi:phenolic glucoside malonyltransferase 1-like [Tripterygium wilfordii]|uniref:phenolic glucoside malonyltransferase 1-like n=1 Tax=Tripterygium wilfordii TaxID=458696 RepID=UPI0018F7F8C6|nr:phenolic glucoside malonyltransferase 1-like [Tripterygium wilfordii]
MFIRAWAHVCKNGNSSSLPADLTPVLDRTLIQDPDSLQMKFLVEWAKLLRDPNPRNLKVMPQISSPESLIWSTFELTGEDIKKLREKKSSQLSEEEEPKSLHLSTFVLVCAYTLSLTAEAKNFEQKKKDFFGFMADVRTRMEPPVPVNYFGNCVASFSTSFEAKDMVGEDGVVLIAKRISEMIKGMERGVLEETKGAPEKFSAIEPGTPTVGVAGSPRFEVYEADSGWGRPKKVEITSVHKTGAFSLAESRAGSGGIEVGLALREEGMDVFAASFADGLRH